MTEKETVVKHYFYGAEPTKAMLREVAGNIERATIGATYCDCSTCACDACACNCACDACGSCYCDCRESGMMSRMELPEDYRDVVRRVESLDVHIGDIKRILKSMGKGV